MNKTKTINKKDQRIAELETLLKTVGEKTMVLLNSIKSADPNVVKQPKIADIIIKDLHTQCQLILNKLNEVYTQKEREQSANNFVDEKVIQNIIFEYAVNNINGNLQLEFLKHVMAASKLIHQHYEEVLSKSVTISE